MDNITVEIIADFDAPSGYGKAARDYVLALDKIGLYVRPVFPRSTWSGGKIDKKTRDKLVELAKRPQKGQVITIENMVPELMSDNPNIAYCVWETNKCPPEWKHKLNRKKAVITSSLASERALINGGVKVPIFVVPHIVELSNVKHVEFSDLKGKVFLTIGEYTYRKNLEDTVYAFLVAMNGVEDATLIVKTCGLNPMISGMKIREFMNSAKNRAIEELKRQEKEIKHPRVIFNDKLLDEEYIPHYYLNADYYITASFGEAWNLPLSEAMYFGLTPIAPYEGGHRMYCTDENAILMQGNWVKAGGVDGNPRYNNAGDWYKITPETIMDAITFAYKNDVSYIGKKASAFMKENLNPSRVANVYKEVLKEISNPIVTLHRAAKPKEVKGNKPFVVKCVQALNEVSWIEKQLANRYDDVDLILVTEGGAHGREDTKKGHSSDGTLEAILNFANSEETNPDDKIFVFTKQKGFDDYEDIKNTFTSFIQSNLSHIENKVIYISDVDEFMTKEDYDKVIQEFVDNPELSEVVPKFLHFYKYLDLVERPIPSKMNICHQRFTKWQKEGMWYFNHPTLTSMRDRVDTACHPAYQERRKVIDAYIYHIGGLKSKEFYKMKHDYYNKKLRGHNNPDYDWKCSGDVPDDRLLIYEGVLPEELEMLQLPEAPKEELDDELYHVPYHTTSSAYNGSIDIVPLFTGMEDEPFLYSK
jgi:glycosyltransferase involved in cell wall biosynthesis